MMTRIYHILPCVITTGYHDIYLNTHMMAKDFASVYTCIYSLMVTPGMHAPSGCIAEVRSGLRRAAAQRRRAHCAIP